MSSVFKYRSESGTLVERGEILPLQGGPQAKMNARRAAMQGCADRMRGWAGDGERIRPRVGDGGFWSVGQVSVRQRLIELEFRNGFRIGGVESAGLIELEEALRRRPSGRQWRGLGREIEIGENGAYGNGIRNEGDDAHRSTTGRADERQHIVDTRDEGGPARGCAAARGAA